jgi:hypothetical protein
MSVKDKEFLLRIEELFNTKIEEYDKALNQITPEFRCTIDNYSIKFHKPNDVIREPENIGDSDGQIILVFNFRLDYTEDEYILHQPGEVINDQTLECNNQILVEYGAQVPSNLKTKLEDLTDLEDKVKTVEKGGNYEYVIDEIKKINPNVGIDECVDIINDNGSYSIPSEMKEKFFQYYRRMDADKILEGFRGYVQIYHNTHIGTLFFIDKFSNFISLKNKVYNDSRNTLQFEMITLMEGNVEVNNVTGLKLTNIKDDTSASLVNHKNDISFMMDCMNPYIDDIVIPKGLRMNQPAELIIQKPGEADGDELFLIFSVITIVSFQLLLTFRFFFHFLDLIIKSGFKLLLCFVALIASNIRIILNSLIMFFILSC